jgi:hypothetical protein
LARLVPTVLAALAAAAPASAACPAEPTFDPAVPTWEQINGFALGSRPGSYAEVVRYMGALTGASPNVIGGELDRRSWRGRTLPYVAVSQAAQLEPPRLATIAATMRAIRAARLAPAEIAAAAADEPAIATVAASVHGDEPSGTDASMRLLYELAARTDCANLDRLERLVTFILPLQNPDGRAAGTRANAYGFDLNRDWFARTQPETDAKLELLRRYPPLVFVDAHEEAGRGYSFPPNADPVHHEVSAAALGAIRGTFARALRAAAERHGFGYATHAHDLFQIGAGDTAVTTAFGAAGMTFAKGSDSAYDERTAEQFATQDATVTAAAADKQTLMHRWARQWREAVRQGRAGALEPNAAVEPGTELRFAVPRTKVFGYFLRADHAPADAARLARRLRSFDVRVQRLRRRAVVRGAHRYGERGSRAERLPRGSFWIPLAQPQKRWIQALLGEDAHVAVPYVDDVSAWSNPLLMGLAGGFASRPNARLPLRTWRGGSLGSIRGRGPVWRFETDSTEALAFVFDALRAGARVVRAPKGVALVTRIARRRAARLARRRDVALRPGSLDPPPRYSVEVEEPKVALLEELAPAGGSSAGFAEYVLERRLGVHTDVLTPDEVDSGVLLEDGYSAFVVGAGPLPAGDVAGAGQIERFVRRGGRYVGFGRSGLAVAAAAGLTLTRERPAPADYQVPGASFRVLVDRQKLKPLGWGLGDETFVLNVGDPILEPDPATGTVVAAYPHGRRFFASGYAEGEDALAGSAAAITDEVGSGQSILLAFDPNFRGYTDGTIRIFANAVVHPVAGDAAAAGARRSRPRASAPGRGRRAP